jgi:hypothetical protein
MRFLFIDKPAAKEGALATPEMMGTNGRFIEQSAK